jgi:rhodanese-related sulfurtransferase
VLFAGGFAAGRESQGAEPTGNFELARLAAPLAGGVGQVSAEQVLAADPDGYLLVDVRGRDAFDFSHATGAVSIPESEMVELAATLPTDRTVVLYCTCPDEKTSLRAGRTLVGVFHAANVVVLKGGLDAYETAGGPVTVAASDTAIEHQGCGCETNAPAFKLWAINQADARDGQATGSTGTEE